MRSLLVLLATVTAAQAEPRRECHLQDAETARTAKQLGCFDDIRSTEDHTYGYRVCLLRARNGVCSGVLWQWEGDPEARVLILETATCGSKDGPVTFSAAERVTSSKGDTIVYMRVLQGKLSKHALRGTFRDHDLVKSVVWKQTKDGFDPLERIRRETQSACSAAAWP
jgi:hypothetical protein